MWGQVAGRLVNRRKFERCNLLLTSPSRTMSRPLGSGTYRKDRFPSLPARAILPCLDPRIKADDLLKFAAYQ